MSKVKISEEMLEELLFFGDTRLTAKTVEDITGNKLSLALLMKRSSENLSGDIDEVVLQMVYGNSRRPPGDERSPSQKLLVKSDEQGEEANTIIGVWAPPNSLAKATALKLLFPTLTAPYRLPETEPSPLYVAVAYDAFKARDVMELSTQYPGQVMAYGFFTSDIPAEAQLIAKTVQKFEERTVPTTYDEKIVVQLAKTNPECLLSFSELGPSYMSADVCVGEMDCNIFFPPGYNAPEIAITEVKKKSKKRGKRQAAAVNKEVSIATSELNVDQSEATETDQVEGENEELESDEEKAGDSVEIDNDTSTEGEKIAPLAGTDKATSPRKEE